MLRRIALGTAVLAALSGCTGPNRVYVDGTASTGSGGASSTSTTGQTVTSTTSTATATGSTSTGATCSDPMHTCTEQAPMGWVGPFQLDQVMAPGAPLPCTGNYGTLVGDYNGSLDEGAPVCNCACNPATGIGCSTAAVLCYDSSCLLLCSGGTSLPPSTCTGVPSSGIANIRISDPPPTQPGSCSPNPTTMIPTPTWGIAAKVCSGTTTPAGCGTGEVCAPVPMGSDQLCVLASGDVACPDAFYATKNTFYAGFTDMRSCSTCNCGPATSDCGGVVNLQSSVGAICGVQEFLEGTVSAGQCGANPMNFNSAVYEPSPTGTCTPSGGTLTGGVMKNGVTTVCCH